MPNTVNLEMPLLEASQAQKHVTHNEALLRLDAVAQLAVKGISVNTPPVSPSDGDRYIVGSSPTGVWLGNAGKLASYQNGAWNFVTVKNGWIVFNNLDVTLYVYNSNTYNVISSALTVTNLGDGILPRLGINTSSDTTNRLSVKSNSVLFSHDDVTPGTGDIKVTINKKLVTNIGGFILQTAFSSKFEFGLVANNDLTIKSLTANKPSFVCSDSTGNVAIQTNYSAPRCALDVGESGIGTVGSTTANLPTPFPGGLIYDTTRKCYVHGTTAAADPSKIRWEPTPQANDGSVKINGNWIGGVVVKPTAVNLPNSPNFVILQHPTTSNLAYSGFPTTSWPQNDVVGSENFTNVNPGNSLADASLVVSRPTTVGTIPAGTTGYLEGSTASGIPGQQTEWRVVIAWSNKAPANSPVYLRCRIFNPDSGFNLSAVEVLPENVTSDLSFFTFVTIADSASLPSSGRFGYIFQISSTNGTVTVQIDSITRFSRLRTIR